MAKTVTFTDEQAWDVVQGLGAAAANAEHYEVLTAKRTARKAGRPYTATDERETRGGCESARRFRAAADIVRRTPDAADPTPAADEPTTVGGVQRALVERGIGWTLIDQMDASQQAALEAAMRTAAIRFDGTGFTDCDIPEGWDYP